MLLDVSMPVVDGLTVCRVLRSERNAVPILMLTARTETSDRVAGLDAGADDYLAKPFDLDELFARMRALVRRVAVRGDGRRSRRAKSSASADLRIETGGRRVTRRGAELELSKTEYELLELLGAQRRDRARPLDDLRPDLALRLRTRLEEPRRLHRLPAAQDRGRRAGAG